MKILITGAGGFVGQNLVNFLLNKNCEIFNLGLKPAENCKHCSLSDISNTVEIQKYINQINPNFLFHLAGTTNSCSDTTECTKVNSVFAENLLNAICNANLNSHTKTIILGSAAEYGVVDEIDLPINELKPPNPVSPYGVSKLAQTNFARSKFDSNKQIVILRPFNIIGPNMPNHLALGSFINQINSSEDELTLKTGNIDTQRDFIDINDVVRIIWILANNPNAQGEIINLCSGVPVSLRMMVDYLIEKSYKTITLETDKTRFRKNDVDIHFGDNAKLLSLIGDYEFTSWRETIFRVVKYYGF